MKLGLIAQEVHRQGGMERAAAEVMERIARVHEIVIIATVCEIDVPGISWIPIRPINRPAFARSWSFGIKARQAEKKLNFDLTNSIGAAAIDADVITAQFCHAAFTARFGGMRGGKGIRKVYQGLVQRIFTSQERKAYTSSRLLKVIAVSQGVKRELIEYYGVDEHKIAVIPNAVDHAIFRPAGTEVAKLALRKKLGLSQTAFICLFVGGDWERKGLVNAIQAVAMIPNANLVVVGRGKIAKFSAIAAEAGAADRIIFTGPTAAPQDYYAASDIFVFPSRYEAFSLVTLEAAASGLPILALRINGTEELIEDGVSGFFVEPGSDSIQQRIREIHADPLRLKTMSKAAVASSLRYSWDRVADEQRQVLEEAAALRKSLQ